MLYRVLAIVLVLVCALSSAAAKELLPWRGGERPPLALVDLDGKAYDLAALRGQVVLVNFWATWCEPCRDEMPSLQRLAARFAGRPLVVLAVNMDEPESRVRKFLEQMPLGFPVLTDPGRAATRAWNVRLLPASFVIGPDGRVRYMASGELDWNDDAVAGRIGALLPARRP